jgi:hypothetical protein
MNAGQALGLLAGLGAVNALGGGRLEERLGGRAATGKRFTGLLDMLDGGGAGASGDKFEGGGLVSMLGNLFAKPLQAQERVEEIAERTSARDSDSSPRPVLRPEGLLSEAQKEQIVMDQIVNPDVYGIGEGGEFAGVPSVAPDVLSGGTVQPMPASSQDANFSGGNLFSPPDLPMREGLPLPRDAEGILAPDLPASERNTKLVSFNRRMETVPEMLRGTEIEGMYRDYVLNGGLGTFGQFTNQSMATEDPAVARSPTPPAMATPSAIAPPTVPVVPEAAGLGMSDADKMMAIRSAIMRDPKMVGALEEAFGVDMVREALAGLRMVGGSPVVSKAPLTRRDQRGLLPTMPITRFN